MIDNLTHCWKISTDLEQDEQACNAGQVYMTVGSSVVLKRRQQPDKKIKPPAGREQVCVRLTVSRLGSRVGIFDYFFPDKNHSQNLYEPKRA